MRLGVTVEHDEKSSIGIMCNMFRFALCDISPLQVNIAMQTDVGLYPM